MRAWMTVIALATLPGAAAAQAPAPPAGACFQVIEGQADVLPNAPLLVDRCTGATFLLARTRRDGRMGYAWVPIAREPAGAAVESAPASEPRSSAAAKAAAKEGCFTYSGRTYCP